MPGREDRQAATQRGYACLNTFGLLCCSQRGGLLCHQLPGSLQPVTAYVRQMLSACADNTSGMTPWVPACIYGRAAQSIRSMWP